MATHTHTHDVPNKFIGAGGGDRLLRLPLVVLAQDVLGQNLLQFARGVGAQAAAVHAAQLQLEHAEKNTCKHM